MKNYKGPGYIRNHLNSSGSTITSNSVVVLISGGSANGRNNIGVAVDDFADGAYGAVRIAGSEGIAKTAGEAYAENDALYWTGTALTSASTGNTYAGTCEKAAASGDTTAQILLNDKPLSS